MHSAYETYGTHWQYQMRLASDQMEYQVFVGWQRRRQAAAPAGVYCGTAYIPPRSRRAAGTDG